MVYAPSYGDSPGRSAGAVPVVQPAATCRCARNLVGAAKRASSTPLVRRIPSGHGCQNELPARGTRPVGLPSSPPRASARSPRVSDPKEIDKTNSRHCGLEARFWSRALSRLVRVPYPGGRCDMSEFGRRVCLLHPLKRIGQQWIRSVDSVCPLHEANRSLAVCDRTSGLIEPHRVPLDRSTMRGASMRWFWMERLDQPRFS